MFQFTGFPSVRYVLAYRYLEFFQVGFPIQTSADHWICASPRSFSQLVTSFFGCQCLGIHPTLFMFNLLNLLDLVFMYDTSVYHTLCLKIYFCYLKILTFRLNILGCLIIKYLYNFSFGMQFSRYIVQRTSLQMRLKDSNFNIFHPFQRNIWCSLYVWA